MLLCLVVFSANILPFCILQCFGSFLLQATIPAASKSGKEPAIVSGAPDAAVEDFVKSYQPETTYMLNMLASAQSLGDLGRTVELQAASPCLASVVLAQHFWSETSKIVVAKCDDYSATGLVDFK